jgi:hypothetical protein
MRVMLKWILQDVRVCTGFIWVSVGPAATFCEHGDEPPGSVGLPGSNLMSDSATGSSRSRLYSHGSDTPFSLVIRNYGRFGGTGCWSLLGRPHTFLGSDLHRSDSLNSYVCCATTDCSAPCLTLKGFGQSASLTTPLQFPEEQWYFKFPRFHRFVFLVTATYGWSSAWAVYED